MTTCIYCGIDKLEKEFSTLEHAIPQFLGGAQAPGRFKLRNACNACNRDLGLFVDGSFSKTWWVANWLNTLWTVAYTPSSLFGPPLVCLGLAKIQLPDIGEDEVCEVWLGPLGERIFLVRPEDERLYWYTGGNPISAKSKNSNARAYFFFSENSQFDPRRTWLSFRDAFKKKRVKKVLCTAVEGADPSSIGFSPPDDMDERRISFLKSDISINSSMQVAVAINLSYDHRFMCKLALGIGYSIFGDAHLNSPYTIELRNGLWHRDGISPAVRGTPAIANAGLPLPLQFLGLENAVVLTVLNVKEGAVIVLNIGQKLVWTVLAATRELTSSLMPKEYEDGTSIILYPQLTAGLELPFPDFLAHQSKVNQNDALLEFERQANGKGSIVTPKAT